MQISKQTLPKSQLELTVELSAEEFKPYVSRGAENVSKEVKIEGFRPGKAPYEILKAKIGEMTILEEAARIAINKTIDKAIEENAGGEPVGQPQVNITKLAPDNPFEYKVVLALLPEIKLGDYKNLKVETHNYASQRLETQGIASLQAADEEVMKTIEHLRESRVKEIIAEREIKSG